MPLPASVSTTPGSSGKEGKSATSVASGSAARSLRQRASASQRTRFIFQLPATSGRRAQRREVRIAVIRPPAPSAAAGERRDAGQLLAGEELERRAAAGRDVPDAVGDPGLMDRGDRLAAADQGEAGAGGEGERHGARPLVERRLLEDPERAVPEQGVGAGDRGGERLAGARADVDGEEVARDLRRVDGLDDLRVVEAVGGDEIGGQEHLGALRRGALEDGAREIEPVALDQRGLEVEALRGEEGIGHAAADHQDVEPRQEVLEGVDLALDLRPAEDRRERPRRFAEELRQRLDLAHHQAAGGLARQVRQHAGDRGVRAMGAAEGVVDVGGGGGGKRPGELRIVLLLAAMEAQVLEQRDVAVAELRGDRRRRLADRVVGEERPAGRAVPRGARPPAAACTSRLRSPFGRPQCEQRRSRAPAAVSSRIVGRASSIRVSSVTLPSFIGTLKSTRTRTTVPASRARSRSSRVSSWVIP